MPVILPKDMPTLKKLKAAGVPAFAASLAPKEEILRIAILNLMPNKEETELQLLLHLAASPLLLAIDFIALTSYQPKNTSGEYLARWYSDFAAVAQAGIDGLIITGAPLEHMEFDQVRYWRELAEIMDYSRARIASTLFICWAAPAALWHYYKIPLFLSTTKLSGLYPHSFQDTEPLFTGLSEPLCFPHSRYFYFEPSSLHETDLQVLAESAEAGIAVIGSPHGREVYVAGHFEYSRDTLQKEYARDLARGLPVSMPVNYFPSDDPAQAPIWTWRDAAQKFYGNWLHHCKRSKE